MSGHERSTARSAPPGRALLAAVLTVPAVVVATQLYVGYRMQGIPVSFAAVIVLQLCHWELWAIAGPLVWRLEARWPLGTTPRSQALIRHALVAPVVSAAILMAYLAIYHGLVRVPGLSAWFAGMDRGLRETAAFFTVAYFHLELFVYGVVIAVAHAVRTTGLLREREHDALRLEAELTGARLAALRTQLQPHFLFNTLHTVGSLVLQRQNDRAVQMLAELGELLRATLAHRDTELAPLGNEIAYLRRYLRIEEARFADRLTVEWDIDPSALDAAIPPFILQPLIENAFRHGISRRPDDSLLRIAAAVTDGTLRITIYNDGPGLAATFAAGEGEGYGLKNVIQRLQTRKPEGRLELVNAERGVRATLVLPLWDAAAPVRS